MKRRSYMVVAGEASGDAVAAELVMALRELHLNRKRQQTMDFQPLHGDLEPVFFGAGGPALAKAGVELNLELTSHAVVGLSDVARKVFDFRRMLRDLADLAVARQPDAVICVDFSGFNRRLAQRIRKRAREADWFHNWHPLLVQYVSPQVWASRAGRAYSMTRAYDLLLTIFPFEKTWYAKRVPEFRVEYVGHPMIDRHGPVIVEPAKPVSSPPVVALLPGSRRSELARHLPVMYGAFELIKKHKADVKGIMVLPNESLFSIASSQGVAQGIEMRVGGLSNVLRIADLAIASTGTVTMECALFGVPTVALYKTSWITYQVGKRIVKVPYLAMPNILAGEEVFPEHIQEGATSENLAYSAIPLLEDAVRRARVKTTLASVIASLGPPGASERAAMAINRAMQH